MKLSTRQQIFTFNISKLIMQAEEWGVKMTFGDAFRSKSQQYLYYYGGKVAHEGGELVIKPAKKRSWTTNSKHLKRLAVDFNYFIDGELTYKHELIDKLGDYWEGLNELNKWGGRFNDTPHWQG